MTKMRCSVVSVVREYLMKASEFKGLWRAAGAGKIHPHWIIGLLLLVVSGCVPAALTTISVSMAQSIETPAFEANSRAPIPPMRSPSLFTTPVAPTPPLGAPALFKALATSLPPTDAKPISIADVALSSTQPTEDPAAIITAQLAQPIAAASESNVSQPSQIPGELNWDGVQRTAKVPILMYHYVSTPPANADIYRKDLSVTPELFNAQLDRIQAEGYTTISLYDLINHLATGAGLPAKPVILTFDDGYRDNYENAFPALKAHGMRATIFVVVDFINAQRPEYMTWDMLREMHNAGLSIESHGIDHSSLKNRDRDSLVFQALRTYETLQNELGQRARFISYPAGQYDQNTIDVFKGAGYWAGITTLSGATHSTDHLFELHRVRVRGTTSADDLAKLLATDW